MSISTGEWDLHQGGSKDASRHREKLKDAFKKQLRDIISEESIITSEKGKKVRVPIRALDSYRFVFDPKKHEHVGQGDGDVQEGDILHRESREGDGENPGDKKAGDGQGNDFYEAEIDIEDLVDMMLEDLKLPRLDPKKTANQKTTDVRYDEVRKKGAMANLDKRRTLIENLKKNAQRGDARVGDLKNDDLRFRTWTEFERPVTSAVVLGMMDVSQSMTKEKKYIARSFFFWMVNFLRRKYEEVNIEFISHTTEAKTCTEEEFFTKGESGGTRCSSAYELATDLIRTKYDPNEYNIFVFHFSDGDTFGDEGECVELVYNLLSVCNMVGYGEIVLNNNEFGWAGSSTLFDAYDSLERSNFIRHRITGRDDIWETLQKFFSEDLT